MTIEHSNMNYYVVRKRGWTRSFRIQRSTIMYPARIRNVRDRIKTPSCLAVD